MSVIDMVSDLPDQQKNELLMSFLGATVFALETKDPAFAVKRLAITASRFGLLEQFQKECAEFDAREAARNEK